MTTDPPLRLFAHYPDLGDALPRVPLVARPTPVRQLEGLGEALGLGELWLKDDSGGPPVGGNKARKLELLVADAAQRGCRTLITVGYLGTNHGLATTLAGRRADMDVELVVIREVVTDHVRDTLLRCAALGAKLHPAGGEVQSTAVIASRLAYARMRGARPYWVPPGGSSPLGTLGYVEAGLELAWQVGRGDLPMPSCIYVPLGSAGTSAGIALGLSLAGLTCEVRAVRVVSPRMASTRRTARLARAAWRQMGKLDRSVEGKPPPLRLRAIGGFEGPGYGTETPEALEAMRLAAETEQLTLEVTYTGRTLACLAQDARDRRVDGPVVLWNTFHPRGAMPEDAPDWRELPRALHRLFE